MSPTPLARPDALQTIAYRRVVSLSHVIEPTIPLWPGDPKVELVPVATFATHGYFLRRLSIGEHSATHINAPNSFFEKGAGIDAYAPEQWVVRAVVIDVRSKAQASADYALTQEDVHHWEEEHGRIAPGSVVLLYTGWQDKWSDPTAFLGRDETGGLHFPGFAGGTTRFLLDERQIAGVGIDTHGVDVGQAGDFPTNTQVLAQSGIVLECLTNLDQLPPTGTTLVLGALRLKDGSGSPVSVMAFIP